MGKYIIPELKTLVENLEWLHDELTIIATGDNCNHTERAIDLIIATYYQYTGSDLDTSDHRIWEASECKIDNEGCMCMMVPIDYAQIALNLVHEMFLDSNIVTLVAAFQTFNFEKHQIIKVNQSSDDFIKELDSIIDVPTHDDFDIEDDERPTHEDGGRP